MSCAEHGGHLSASSISTSEKCQLMMYYAHIMRIKRAPGIAQEYGSNMHKVLLEIDQATKIETGAYKPLGELKEKLTEGLQASIQIIDDLDHEVITLGGKSQAYSAYQKVGLDTLDRYNEDRSVLDGRAVEVAFDVPVADTTLVGRLDLDVSDSRAKDLKTKDLSRPRSKRPTQAEVEKNTQFKVYPLVKFKQTGNPTQFFDAVYAYKKSDPEIQSFSTVSGLEDHKLMEDRVARLHKVVDSGGFYPTGQNTFWCQQRFCGYWDSICDYGRRQKVTVGFNA